MGNRWLRVQDFVNWVCSGQSKSDFLKYLFLAEGAPDFCDMRARPFTRQSISEAKAFVFVILGSDEQIRDVDM